MDVTMPLSAKDFIEEWLKRPGLIPTNIDVDAKKIIWTDIGKYHFYESFMHKSVNMFYRLSQNKVQTFATDFEVLLDTGITQNAIYPSGFIYHVGRCGSTLLVKALARSRAHLVLSEPGPLNQILFSFRNKAENSLDGNEDHKKIYRLLVLALLRHRVASHKHAFIKFTSYNIQFFDFIHSIFPNVPALFLTRNCAEVVDSYQKKKAGYFDLSAPDLQFLTGSDRLDIAQIMQNNLAVSQLYPDAVLKKMDYTQLNRTSFFQILTHFNCSPTSKDLALMQAQFQYYSKNDFSRQIFQLGDKNTEGVNAV